MSTYLQLCVKARQNCGIAGTGPTTVIGQIGELKNIVDWMADAYVEVQNRHTNWRFLRHGFTLSTVASTHSYSSSSCTDVTASAAISRFGSWYVHDIQNPPKAYLASNGVGGEYWLRYIPWDNFNVIYGISNQNENAPSHITVTPQDTLRFGQVPNDVYTVTGEYYRSAQVLAADADVPEIPSQYHNLLVYLVMEKYGMMEGAPEVVARGDTEGRKLMKQLEKNQLPKFRMRRTMA